MEISQIVLFMFLAAIALVAYDMRLSLRPPVCAECAHCRAAQEGVQQHRSEMRDFSRRRYSWRDREDEDR